MRSIVMVLAAAAGFAAAACSDPTTPPLPQGGDGLQFTDEQGHQFAAVGYPGFTDGSVDASTFAIAFPDSVGGLVISSFDANEGTRGDLFILQLTENRTGDFPVCGSSHPCHGRLLVGIDAANLSDVREAWELTSGSVTITSIGGGTLAGTFTEFVYTRSHDSGETRRVSSGSFEVPLLDEQQARGAMECFLASATGGSCDA